MKARWKCGLSIADRPVDTSVHATKSVVNREENMTTTETDCESAIAEGARLRIAEIIALLHKVNLMLDSPGICPLVTFILFSVISSFRFYIPVGNFTVLPHNKSKIPLDTIDLCSVKADMRFATYFIYESTKIFLADRFYEPGIQTPWSAVICRNDLILRGSNGAL